MADLQWKRNVQDIDGEVLCGMSLGITLLRSTDVLQCLNLHFLES
jgi:hypothetical protein